MHEAENEARRALNRLRRALEKGRKELDTLSATLRHAESDDFPADAYEEAAARIDGALDFVDEEARRLQDKVLQAGGLEPGRMRHSSYPGG